MPYRRRKGIGSDLLLLALLGCALIALLLPVLIQKIPFDTIIIITFTVGIFAIIIAVAVLWYISHRRRERQKALNISEIDIMIGVQFEQYVGEILRSQGYHIAFTKTSGDFGSDIIAQKDGIKYVMQLKRYHGSVGIEVVQQAVASKAYYHAHTCMVITNSYFTEAAKQLARVNGCELINRDILVEWIVQFQKS